MNTPGSKKAGAESYAADSPLGRSVAASESYSPDILHPIPRTDYRATLEGNRVIKTDCGQDIWNCYEVSWLNSRGRPEVRIAQITVPADSTSIVESKSLKLYLNSLAGQRFANEREFTSLVEADLQSRLGCSPVIELAAVTQDLQAATSIKPERESAVTLLVDTLDVQCDSYRRQPDLLVFGQAMVQQQKLQSHLLRTLCPVTGQPDWASVSVVYSGQILEPESLLKYIVSFREHQGFHEQCVEQIFLDLVQRGNFDRLVVEGQFTRRGGIDINPCRSFNAQCSSSARINRQ